LQQKREADEGVPVIGSGDRSEGRGQWIAAREALMQVMEGPRELSARAAPRLPPNREQPYERRAVEGDPTG
jgi:hypothetical protein